MPSDDGYSTTVPATARTPQRTHNTKSFKMKNDAQTPTHIVRSFGVLQGKSDVQTPTHIVRSE